MRDDDLSSLREGLGLQGAILTKEAEQAFLTRGIANRDTIYPAEYEAVTSAHKITALFGANQSGKTLSMAHRAAWDATGLYPDWYPGPRTSRGIDAWVIGDTGMNVRDSYQRKLFGPDPNRPGWTDRPGEEALISAKYLASPPNKQGQPAGLFDTVRIKHVPSETTSTLTFKSHQMDTQSLASRTLARPKANLTAKRRGWSARATLITHITATVSLLLRYRTAIPRTS